jgi:hypothetical protein
MDDARRTAARVGYYSSVIFSENRHPLFGITPLLHKRRPGRKAARCMRAAR